MKCWQNVVKEVQATLSSHFGQIYLHLFTISQVLSNSPVYCPSSGVYTLSTLTNYFNYFNYFKYTYQLTTLLASKTSNVEVAKVTNVSTWIYVCETNQLSKLGSVGILTMIKLVRFKTYSPEPGTVKTFWNIIYTSHKL